MRYWPRLSPTLVIKSFLCRKISMKADRNQVNQLLKTARGQIDGILKMVEQDRYCIDISHQLMATESLLHKTNLLVMHAHLESCLKDAFENGNEQEKKEKLDEILKILERY